MAMELRHLRYFVAVAEEGHVTRAAVRLGMQQPPLSMQIRQLETELGVRLLERLPRGVELTEAGQVFLEDARAILAAVQRAGERAEAVADGRVGRLSFGFTTSAVLHPYAATLLRAFRAAYPAVVLDLQEGNAAELTQAVAGETLAAALLRMPVERPRGLAFAELLSEAMVVAVPAGHRLAEEGATGLRALREEHFILVRRPGAPGLYRALIEACRRVGFEVSIAAEVPHMLTAVNLVAAGVGVAVLPGSMREIGLGGVRYLDLVEAGLRAPLTLVFREGDGSALLANLRGIAVGLAGEAGGLGDGGLGDGGLKPTLRG